MYKRFEDDPDARHCVQISHLLVRRTYVPDAPILKNFNINKQIQYHIGCTKKPISILNFSIINIQYFMFKK